MTACVEVVARLRHKSALRAAGIHVEQMQLVASTPDSLYCGAQNERAAMLGELSLRLVAARLLRTMWCWNGPSTVA
eukprot:5923182-Amphidinium_carterae.1